MSDAEASGAQLLDVRVEPDTPAMKAQPLLKPYPVSKRVITLGRRRVRHNVSDEGGAADHLIADPYPYTVSRLHCEIERAEGEVIVRDLGSRFGTVVNGQRLNGHSGLQSEISLGSGEHSLILGRRHGRVRFRLVVSATSDGESSESK